MAWYGETNKRWVTGKPWWPPPPALSPAPRSIQAWLGGRSPVFDDCQHWRPWRRARQLAVAMGGWGCRLRLPQPRTRTQTNTIRIILLCPCWPCHTQKWQGRGSGKLWCRMQEL